MARLVLRPEQLHGARFGSDEGESGGDDRPRERRILTEEPVPRVHGLALGRPRRIDQLVDVEIRLQGGFAAEVAEACPRRSHDVGGLAIDVAVHHHGLASELLESTAHADRDLTAIGNQNAVERGRGRHRRKA